MSNEEHEYNAGCAAQAEAEYQAEMAWYEYLDGLLVDNQYELHAIEIALNLLYKNKPTNPIEFLELKRKQLNETKRPTTTHP